MTKTREYVFSAIGHRNVKEKSPAACNRYLFVANGILVFSFRLHYVCEVLLVMSSFFHSIFS